MRTWQKAALGCGWLLVLGELLVDEAPVQTGEFDFDTVYAFFSRDSMDENEGTRRIRIFHDGEVVMEGEATARAGNVSVDRSPNK